MSESKFIERVLTSLLGNDMARIGEIKIRWEDDVIISLQWSMRESGATGSAKVLKLPNGEWKILNSII
jgi:hypothetical protein